MYNKTKQNAQVEFLDLKNSGSKIDYPLNGIYSRLDQQNQWKMLGNVIIKKYNLPKMEWKEKKITKHSLCDLLGVPGWQWRRIFKRPGIFLQIGEK